MLKKVPENPNRNRNRNQRPHNSNQNPQMKIKPLNKNIEKESAVEAKPLDKTGVVERLFKSVPEPAAKIPSKKAKSV